MPGLAGRARSSCHGAAEGHFLGDHVGRISHQKGYRKMAARLPPPGMSARRTPSTRAPVTSARPAISSMMP